MTSQEYFDLTHEIVNSKNPQTPYDEPDYHQYTVMNETRMKRWLKMNPITEETTNIIHSISQPQTWILITEPWCGDAAHIVPILHLMSQLNARITLEIQLRDSNSEIEKYLTNGTKSIPVLIVRDTHGEDIFHWGPRPKAAQDIYLELKAQQMDSDEIKASIQNFYNKDKSLNIQKEVSALIKTQAN
ncbi:MAG TPA: thioredoxin family protein [Niabella sp.]|nr:thioredoxin family protein [Niabella sp.]HOZ96824.1 thioredoxin family protein [Niabella sp.]HQW14699.1 thioredoxin family protein [Niabella sp.]HQX20049.1 thioredoxin family protein [Niabella sp.]HQX42349.1 thioredoxin family protein [Niabella sp.]